MDPIRNPYSPGAGTRPPELAGRSALLRSVAVAIGRVRAGRASKSVMVVGLRGVGKTVLLAQMRDDAESSGAMTMWVEAPERRSLPAILCPSLRQVLLRLSVRGRAADLATRALRGLAGFVKAMRVKYHDIEVGLDLEAEPGLADNGDLEHDLQALLTLVGEAARADESVIAMFIDEMQYVAEDELASLITALHATTQRSLPVVLIGAGLPQLRGRMGRAKSYAERLFDFPEVGPLDESDARRALEQPARAEGVEYESAALQNLIRCTHRYPYFIQEWGKHAWDVASTSPIGPTDVTNATAIAIAALDASFFRVRFDRLTPFEKKYLRAMAELGPGPHRSGEVADVLVRRVTALGPTRKNLIEKGVVWSPSHGDIAFTVPLFDEFMKRIMPGDEWRSE